MPQLTDQQVNEIRNAATHSKIEAVKIYKQLTGASLLESKSFVETLMDGGVPASHELFADAGLTAEQMDKVLDELDSGNKLGAIKYYRTLSGKSLLESKVFVEKLIESLGIDLPAAKGCSATLLLVVTLGASVIAGFWS